MHQDSQVIRVVTDVNIWVSYLLTPKFRQCCDVLFTQRCIILVSDTFFQELQDTLFRSDMQKRVLESEAVKLVIKLHKISEEIYVHSKINICRDPDDNYLLELSQDGNADFLITRDKDLRILGRFGDTQIVTLQQFIELQSE